MRIKTLQMFVKLVELGSYSLAADSLNITQPAVTMQIKSLEEYFATELITRDKGEINLTPSGRILYNRSKKILFNWEIAENKVNSCKGLIYTDFKIGASTIPSVYLLPEKLALFSDKFPEIKIIMETGDSRNIIDKLDKGEIDTGVIGFKPDAAKFKETAVARDRLALIVPADSSLINKDKVTLNDLLKERMLIRERGSGTRKVFLSELKRKGINFSGLNVKAVLGSTEAVIAAVEAGLGISFISNLAARKAVSDNRVRKIEVENLSVSRNFYLAYHQSREDELLIKVLSSCF